MTGRSPVIAAAGPDGLTLRVRLTPKSSRDAVEGTVETAEGPALAARVRAAPTEGEANAALVVLIAQSLHVPKSAVTLARGGKSRVKLLTVAGKADVLERALIRTLVQGQTGKKR